MTEYELADAISSYAVQGGTFFTVWLTIVSAYALVAYVTGKNLTGFQIMWLNTTYLIVSFLSIFGFYGAFSTQAHYAQLIRELNPSSPQLMRAEVAIGIVLITIIGTLVTFCFMWSVRNQKVE